MNVCYHDWEAVDGWGVVLGVSRCRRCGKVADADDFNRRRPIDHDSLTVVATLVEVAVAAAFVYLAIGVVVL